MNPPDRNVRQSTIKKTIRPPVGYTNALKIEQMILYGETGSPSDYEEDHFIPLELGGAPKNLRILGPSRTVSRGSQTRSKRKRKVCKGLMKLVKARAQIRAFKFENG